MEKQPLKQLVLSNEESKEYIKENTPKIYICYTKEITNNNSPNDENDENDNKENYKLLMRYFVDTIKFREFFMQKLICYYKCNYILYDRYYDIQNKDSYLTAKLVYKQKRWTFK
jgi:hypothetical protein